MKNYLLLQLSFALTSFAHSQSVAQRMDDSLKLVDKQTKFHLKKTKSQDGETAFFFKKNNNELFSIVVRKLYRDRQGRPDSAASMGFIFNNGMLVKANYIRQLFIQKDRKHRRGVTSFYFNNNVLIEKTTEDNYSGIDVDFMIKQANDLLLRSKYVQ
jgi:hypothetical protein